MQCITKTHRLILMYATTIALLSHIILNLKLADLGYIHQSHKTSGNSSTTVASTRSNGQARLTKPKLILHVGPRKTGTTTIQQFLFNQHGAPKVIKDEISRDNFRLLSLSWVAGCRLLHYFNHLPDKNNTKYTKHYSQLNATLRSAIALKQDVAISHEALSSLIPSEDTKDCFLSLTEGFDVHVVITYRPLLSYYRSLYIQRRGDCVYLNGNSRYYREWAKQDPTTDNNCQIPFQDWFAINWKSPASADPLISFKTYAYIFGKSRVKVLDLFHPNHIDIVQQFICDGMKAKHACEKIRHTNPPSQKNKSKPITLFEEDLVVMAAKNKNLLPYTSNSSDCTVTDRHEYALRLRDHLWEEHSMKITDFPKVCLSKKQLDDLKDQSWEAEQNMSPNPMMKHSFEASFHHESIGEEILCSLDVDTALFNSIFVSFFSNETWCVDAKYKS